MPKLAPPIHSRFAPGVSGNPAGRKKLKPSFLEDAAAVLNEPVKIKSAGRSTKAPSFKAMAKQVCKRALAGERDALRLVVDIAMIAEVDDTSEADARVAGVDSAIQRMRRLYRDWSEDDLAETRRIWLEDFTLAERRERAALEKRAKASLRARGRRGFKPDEVEL